MLIFFNTIFINIWACHNYLKSYFPSYGVVNTIQDILQHTRDSLNMAWYLLMCKTNDKNFDVAHLEQRSQIFRFVKYDQSRVKYNHVIHDEALRTKHIYCLLIIIFSSFSLFFSLSLSVCLSFFLFILMFKHSNYYKNNIL